MKKIFVTLFSFLTFHLNVYAQFGIEEDATTIPKESPKVEMSTYINPYSYLDSLNYSRKKIYNVAFILPINRNKIKLGDGKDFTTSMSQESREVLGFWEGVNIAFAKIKKMNAKFNFHIWDNEAQDSLTSNIINELERMKIDAIVAPFHTKQAMRVSEYSKRKRIPVFLAQNPSDAPAKTNPFAFKFLMPKNRMFYDYYVKAIKDVYAYNQDIYFVFDGLNKNERKIANYLKYMAEKDGTNPIKFIEYSSDLNFKNYMDTTKKSLYFVSFYNTTTVNEIIDKLYGLKDYKVSVFGHSLWANNGKLNLEKLEALEAKVYSDEYIGLNGPLTSEIKSSYSAMTKDNIVSEVYTGYDVAMYIAEVLDKYGVKFPLSIEDFQYQGVAANYHLRPNYDGKGKILFFENDKKFLLRSTKTGWSFEE